MAGKVLKKEDFESSGDPTKEDTSSKAIDANEVIDTDQKFNEKMEKIEEPEKEEVSKEKELPDSEEEKEPLSKPSDDKKYKYSSMDDYDKAYKEAERKMHEATTKSADLERRLSALEKPPEKPKTIDDRITEIANEAYDRINALPIEFDPEGKARPESVAKRDRDAAVIWAKANRDISRLEIDETTKRSQSHQDTVSKLYNQASKEGLKSEDELDMIGIAFDRTDPSLDLDTRVERAVESVKVRLSRLRQGFVQKQETDKKEKEELRVLGRGSNRQGEGKKKEDTKPTSMSQQLNDMNESRRLKKDDLWH